MTKAEMKAMVEAAAERICDNYCKMPNEYLYNFEDSEQAMDEMRMNECEECPLSELLEAIL